uniref:RNA-binding protein n=1 Tax=Knipowitschia caucasica TaxID=637954 RepID=A0AAV2KMK2_KNICA
MNNNKIEKENEQTEFSNHEEEVRTLFVSGLPLDIKPRELYLLFRPFKGYEGSLIKLTSKQGLAPFDRKLPKDWEKFTDGGGGMKALLRLACGAGMLASKTPAGCARGEIVLKA